MKVLVAYGSKMGGTAGLARMVADSLRGHGHEVEVRPAAPMPDLADFDAVVVGGALYALRWHKAARMFVRRHAPMLRTMPVYFFSSGPLDDSAVEGDIPATPQVAGLMRRVAARSHITFGGRLAEDAKGWPASMMAKKAAGDWRDAGHVDRWVQAIDADLRAQQPVA